MDAFERAKRRYYNHEPMPQAAEYVKQLEVRVAALEAERETPPMPHTYSSGDDGKGAA